MGRLFDAVSSLLGLGDVNGFEGQAAMALEWAATGRRAERPYALPIVEQDDGFVLDWAPAISAMLDELENGVQTGRIAARFHRALIEAIVGVSRHHGIEKVVLTGGCFQNRRLTEGAVTALADAGFTPVWHQRIPPNDGGISLGQIAAAQHQGVL
jgi:hydrogenase maturation protein HypF